MSLPGTVLRYYILIKYTHVRILIKNTPKSEHAVVPSSEGVEEQTWYTAAVVLCMIPMHQRYKFVESIQYFDSVSTIIGTTLFVSW